MSKFTFQNLNNDDLKFIRDKIIENHPAYILDTQFHQKLNSVRDENLDDFITINGNTSFRLNFKFKGIKPAKYEEESSYENYDYETDDNIAMMYVNSFEEKPYDDFLEFCEDLSSDSKIKDIILDLRDNAGGSLEYMNQVLEALYGKEMLKFLHYKVFNNTKVLWRNNETVRNVLKRRNVNLYNEMSQVTNDIYIEELNYTPVSLPFNKLNNKNLFILINKGCKNNLLTFLDFFEVLILNHPTNNSHSIGHIYLVGEPTDYQNEYSDSLTFNSSKFTLSIPMKKTLNSFREMGTRYIPTISIRDLNVTSEGIEI